MARSLPLYHVAIPADKHGDVRIERVVDTVGAAIEARGAQREVRWLRDDELTFDHVPYNQVLIVVRAGTRLSQNREVLRQRAKMLLLARTQDLLGRSASVAVYELPRLAALSNGALGVDCYFGDGLGWLPGLTDGVPKQAKLFVRAARAAGDDPGQEVSVTGPLDKSNASAGWYPGQLGVVFALSESPASPASAGLPPRIDGRDTQLVFIGKRHLDDVMQVSAVTAVSSSSLRGWGRGGNLVHTRYDYVEQALHVRELDGSPASQWWRNDAWLSVADLDGELFQFRLEQATHPFTAYPEAPDTGGYFEVTGLHLPDPDIERGVRSAWLNLDDRNLPVCQPFEPVKHILAVGRLPTNGLERGWHAARQALDGKRPTRQEVPLHALIDARDQHERDVRAGGIHLVRQGTHNSRDAEVRLFASVFVSLQKPLFVELPPTDRFGFDDVGIDRQWLDEAAKVEQDDGEILGLGAWFARRFPQFQLAPRPHPATPQLVLLVDEEITVELDATGDRLIDVGPLRLMWRSR